MESDDEDFAVYGNSLDPIDEESLPRKKAITVEDQYATDEHGRRRFHGAFTGGFSAGFCNSVGSLEGWQPSNFISSRSSRSQVKSQNVLDFMDDEDKSEHGICPMSVKVKPDYDDKSENTKSKKRVRGIKAEGLLSGSPMVKQIFEPVRDTVGVKLLMKMGWKPGQGIGPRVTKTEKQLKRKTEQQTKKIYACELPTNVTNSDEDQQSDESEFDITLDDITFAPDDYQSYIVEPKQNTFGLGYKGIDRRNILSSNKPEFSKLTVNGKSIRGQAFGVSVFEDDDDDIYHTEDMSNYDFSLESNESKNINSKKHYTNDVGCIEGFHMSIKVKKLGEKFPLPVIPEDFVPLKSRKLRWESDGRIEPKKKITSAVDRMKLIDDEINIGFNRNKNEREQSETVPRIPDSTFKPFTSDKKKQSRYETFLMYRKLGLKDRLDNVYPPTMTEWEKEREKSEFEQAARIYRPLSDAMASRFITGTQEDNFDILKPVEKTISPEEQALRNAVAKKMYGSLTRRKLTWIPDRILCKRFNVPEPVTCGLQRSADTTNQRSHRISIFECLKSDVSGDVPKNESNDEPVADITVEKPNEETQVTIKSKEEEDEENEKKEELNEKIANITKKVDLFKAIFLSSSEDEEEQEDDDVKEMNDASTSTEIKNKVIHNINYSPPRGIFTNLDLDSLRHQPKTVKTLKPIHVKEELTPIEELSSIPSESKLSASDIGPDTYGPKLPLGLIRPSTDKLTHIFKNKHRDVDDIWVEKSHKHKKSKKQKKHKKHK